VQQPLVFRFPKIKEEGWFVVLGDEDSGELLAMRRVGLAIGRTTRTTLVFPSDIEAGSCLCRMKVFLLADSYLGLDQVLELPTQVGGGEAEAGVGVGEYMWEGREPLELTEKATA
jgi:activating signal cointegrator complex subunit 3